MMDAVIMMVDRLKQLSPLSRLAGSFSAGLVEIVA